MVTVKHPQPSHQESKRPPRARRKTWTPAEEDELATLYGTATAETLADRYGVSAQCMRNKESHMGITNKTPRGRPKNKPTDAGPLPEEQTTLFGKQTVITGNAARIITHIMR